MNYDENMLPILTEEQHQKEWLRENTRKALRQILEEDKYLQSRIKAGKNIKDYINEQRKAIKDSYNSNSTEVKEQIKEILSFVNMSSIDALADEIDKRLKYESDNYEKEAFTKLNRKYPDLLEEDYPALFLSEFKKNYISSSEILNTRNLISILNEIDLIIQRGKASTQEQKNDINNQISNLNKRRNMISKTIDTRKKNLKNKLDEEYIENRNKLEDSEKYTENSKFNMLLQAEIDILTHKDNYWQMMAPLIDDYLSDKETGMLAFMTNKVKEWKKNNEDINYIENDDKAEFSKILTLDFNIEKTVLYIQGKSGVAVFALQGTGHAIVGFTPIEIESSYTEEKGKRKTTVLTSLPLDNDLYANNLNSLVSKKSGMLISDIFSQLLTSQVDIGKNPYPALLGLILENLTFISYGIRRAVPLEILLQIVEHPEVKRFIQYRQEYESIFSKAYSKDIGATKIKEEYWDNNFRNFKDNKGRPVTSFQRVDDGLVLVTEEVELNGRKFIEISNSNTPGSILLAYFQILDQSTKYSEFVRSMRYDTQTKKNRQEVEKYNTDQIEVTKSKFIKSSSLTNLRNNSILAPFVRLQQDYDNLFKNFYLNVKMKGAIQDIQDRFYFTNSKAKEKLFSSVNSSFISYVIQKHLPNYLKENKILEGTLVQNLNYNNFKKALNELISMVNTFKNNNPNIADLFFNNITIVLEHIDKTSSIRTKDRIRNPLTISDMLDSFKEIKDVNENVYNALQIIPLLSTGVATGRYNYQDILPAKLRFDIIQYALTKELEVFNNYDSDFKELIIGDFIRKFALANPYALSVSKYRTSKVAREIYALEEIDDVIINQISLGDEKISYPKLNNPIMLNLAQGDKKIEIIKKIDWGKSSPIVNETTTNLNVDQLPQYGFDLTKTGLVKYEDKVVAGYNTVTKELIDIPNLSIEQALINIYKITCK